MATILNQNEEEDKDLQPSAGPSAPTAPSSSGPQPGLAGTPPVRTQGTGRFTNLAKYQQANQGAGSQLAQKIGSSMEKQGKTVAGAVSRAASGVKAGVEQEQNRLSQANTIAAQLASDASQVDVDTAQNLMQGSVNAPSTQGLMEASSGINKLQANKNLAASQSGRAQLLREAFKRPTYTTGQSSLDSALLNLNPNVRGLEQKAQQQFQTAQKQISDAQAMVQKATPELASRAARMQELLKNTVGEQYKTQLSGAETAAKTFNERSNTLMEYIKGGGFFKDLGQGQVTTMPVGDIVVQQGAKPVRDPKAPPMDRELFQDAMRTLESSGLDLNQITYGLSKDRLQQLINANVAQGQAITAEQAIDDQARARLNVLSRLSNVDPSRFGADVKQATDRKFNFRAEDYNKEIDAARVAAEEQLKNTKLKDVFNQKVFNPTPAHTRGYVPTPANEIARLLGDKNLSDAKVTELYNTFTDPNKRGITSGELRALLGTSALNPNTPDSMIYDQFNFVDSIDKRMRDLGMRRSLADWEQRPLVGIKPEEPAKKAPAKKEPSKKPPKAGPGRPG